MPNVLVIMLSALIAAQPTPRPTPDVRDLPLVELPVPARSNGALVILMTGDGDWAELDRGIARTLTDAGSAVVALKARTYLLGADRSPESMTRDIERIARHYLPLWNRDRLVLVGYSRGADLLPFAVARLAPDLRNRVGLLAMLGLSTTANFRFHWSDLVKDSARPTDFAVAPELARLRGLRMLCVYGAGEKESGCRGADSTLLQRVERPGGHHFDGDYAAIAGSILDALGRR